jgi:hypothetical protein
MKLLKAVSASVLFYLLFFSSTTQFVACQKDTIHDTLIVKDTVTIRDTLTVRDTVDCNCYDLKDGLVAWYNFKGGNLNDSSGKNNHIIFNNAVKTADRFGNANGAYQFNGTSTYMRVANNASINPATTITMAAVIKINSFYTGECHGNTIISKAFGVEYVNGFYSLGITDHLCGSPVDVTKEKFTATYGNNTNGLAPFGRTDTLFAQTGQWYSFVYTFENGTSKLYVNGVLKDSRQAPFAFTANPADLFIGKQDNAQYPYWFNGVIDDIRIYNRALCDGEVKQLNRSKD